MCAITCNSCPHGACVHKRTHTHTHTHSYTHTHTQTHTHTNARTHARTHACVGHQGCVCHIAPCHRHILCAAATITRCMYIPPPTSSATTMMHASTHILPPKPTPLSMAAIHVRSMQSATSAKWHVQVHAYPTCQQQPHATVNGQRCQPRQHVYMQKRA